MDLLRPRLQRACPRFTHKAENVLLGREKHYAGKQLFRFGYKIDLNSHDHAQRTLAPDEQVHYVHSWRAVISGGAFTNLRHLILRQARFNRISRRQWNSNRSSVDKVGATAQIDHFTIGQHDSQALNILASWSILESPGSGCIRCHSAANKAATFSRIGRIKEAFV